MCINRVQPGGHCQYNEQCLDSSRCQNGACICPNGMENLSGYVFYFLKIDD